MFGADEQVSGRGRSDQEANAPMNGIDRAQMHHQNQIYRATNCLLDPDCNLDGLAELTFFFDQDGHLIDCIGKVEGDDTERDYAGLGLILTYEMACRGFARRSQKPAEIVRFPGGPNA